MSSVDFFWAKIILKGAVRVHQIRLGSWQSHSGIGVCVSFKFSAETPVQFSCAPTYLNSSLLTLEMWFKYTQE